LKDNKCDVLNTLVYIFPLHGGWSPKHVALNKK